MSDATNILNRFLGNVVALDPEQGECWPWQGTLTDRGYGRFHIDRSEIRSHRWSYEHFNGAIPDGRQIDHLCRNRACCNPDHLEAVTPRENTLRGEGTSGLHAQQTHCIHGHELSGDNLYTYRKPSGLIMRGCRKCRRDGERRRRALGCVPARETKGLGCALPRNEDHTKETP